MKKIICFLFVVSLSVYQAYNQNRAVDLWANFDQSYGGTLNFYSNNNDFCDYYLLIFFDSSVEGFEGMSPIVGTPAVVSRGKRLIRTYKKKAYATRYFYKYSYVFYRGSGKKPDTDFVYALPTAANEAVTTSIVGIPPEHQFVFDLPSDTVYACRDGVMCDDNLRNHSGRTYSPVGMSQITLYHSDGSFGEYIFKGKPLIAPGKKVKMGSPIAIVENFLDKYSVRFSVYFLDKKKLNNPKFRFLPKYTRFAPVFQTVNEGKG